jgi:hypothetical protein
VGRVGVDRSTEPHSTVAFFYLPKFQGFSYVTPLILEEMYALSRTDPPLVYGSGSYPNQIFHCKNRKFCDVFPVVKNALIQYIEYDKVFIKPIL